MADKIRIPILEISLAEHCNLRCAACNHASPHFDRKFAELEAFKADIAEFTRTASIEEMRFIGGEPLLNRNLEAFLEEASRDGVCDWISIITNGTLLDRASDSVWKLADTIVVSVYPGVTLPMSEKEMEGKAKKHGTKLQIRRKPRFELLLVNNEIKDAAVVGKIFSTCKIAHTWKCHTVHDGRYYKCPVASYVEERLNLIGIRFDNKKADSVQVRGNPNLPADLKSYLEDKTPLMACRFCLGTMGKRVKSFQLDSAGLKRELAEDHSDTSSLLAKVGNP